LMASNRLWAWNCCNGRLVDRKRALRSHRCWDTRGLRQWSAGQVAAERKLRLFNDRFIGLAIDQLALPVAIPDLALKRQMSESYSKMCGPNGTAHANSRVEVRRLIESAKLLG